VANIEPSNATNKKVNWTSNDSSIASVDDEGNVTGKGVGSATIIATTADGGKKATCSVKVTSSGSSVAVTGIKLDKSSITIGVGESQTLVATIEPSNATNKKVNWATNDSAIATVDDNGTVTGKGVGNATIIATTADGGKKATCSVKVTASSSPVAVTGVTLDKSTLTMTVGEDVTLKATVKPDDATDKTVTWASDKTSVATVDENGKVSAKAAGTAVITVTTKDGGKTAKCTVTVKAASVAVTGVSLDKTTLTLTEGESATLKATVKPDDASNKQVTWSSDKESVATVDENGKVTAKAAGTSDNIIEVWDFADGLDDPEHVKATYGENPPNVYGFGHTPLYADVIDAIQTGRKPYVDGEAGKRALELVLAIYKSAAEHRPVKLPLDDCNTMDFVGRFGEGSL
jgi:uncharacterized protein YjdB